MRRIPVLHGGWKAQNKHSKEDAHDKHLVNFTKECGRLSKCSPKFESVILPWIMLSKYQSWINKDYVECLMKTAFTSGQVSHVKDEGVTFLEDDWYVWCGISFCSLYERPDKDIDPQIFHRCQLHESQCNSGFNQERYYVSSEPNMIELRSSLSCPRRTNTTEKIVYMLYTDVV